MRFTQKDLARKILFSNPDLLKFFEQAADYRLSQLDLIGTWGAKVRHILEAAMNSERQTIDMVADKLQLETRTLQNYLKRENTGFRRIYLELRKQKALQLLGDPSISIIEIAFFLGFSEQSAFNHAFKKWTGDTPIEYRLGRNRAS
jgi:AraC-like DNA-binding protein